MKVDLWTTLAINYIVCFLVSTSIPMMDKGLYFSLVPTISQFILGVLFVLGYMVTQLALKSITLQKTTLFQRLSLVIPIIVAALYLNQPIEIMELPGFLLAIVAIYYHSTEHGTRFRFNLGMGTLLLFLVWFLNGCIDTGFLLVSQETRTIYEQVAFLSPIFFIAMILSLCVALIRGIKLSLKYELQLGFILGLSNVAAIFFFMNGFQAFEEDAIFVTLNHSGIILLAGICGSYLFDEKITRRKWIGTTLAILAIIWLVFTR